MDFAVQPSERCIDRIGRGLENRKISFLRTEKIWLVTSFERSEAKKITSGATLSALILFSFSTRDRCASVSVGIEAVILLHAKGATQFERTPKRAISSAIDWDSPTTPILAAE